MSQNNSGPEEKRAFSEKDKERYLSLVPEFLSAIWPGPNPNSKFRLEYCVITLFRNLVEIVRLVKQISLTMQGYDGTELFVALNRFTWLVGRPGRDLVRIGYMEADSTTSLDTCTRCSLMCPAIA